MMSWEYKVVSTEELFPDQVDHDIAVSKQAASTRRSKLSGGLQGNLNRLGAEGWEFISIFGELAVFKRPGGR